MQRPRPVATTTTAMLRAAACSAVVDKPYLLASASRQDMTSNLLREASAEHSADASSFLPPLSYSAGTVVCFIFASRSVRPLFGRRNRVNLESSAWRLADCR